MQPCWKRLKGRALQPPTSVLVSLGRGKGKARLSSNEEFHCFDELGMNSHTLFQPTVPRATRGILAVLTVVGIAGFVVTAMLGFEEPNTPMLLVSGAMTLAAPITALVHLSVTRGLTHYEKLIWLKEFGSAEVWSALSEYLSSTNLSESAKRRAHDALARRESK
jgi:hypothetical protein